MSLNLTRFVLVSPAAGSKLSLPLQFSLGRLVVAALPAFVTACVCVSCPPLQL